MEHKSKLCVYKMDDKGKGWLLLCLAISFMVCVFAPLETFFANETEFWFELSQILPVVIIAFLVVSLLSFSICILLQKSKIAVYIYGLLFCGMLSFYIQGNYIPRNYGVLDGVAIDWDDYTAYAITSIVLFLGFGVLWIIISIKVKEKIYSVGKFVCAILFLMQVVTLGTLFIQSSLTVKSDSGSRIVTTKDAYSLSEENNVLVFVLDSFDAAVMKEIVQSEEGERFKGIFEDFTYYPDTLGGYPTTRGAMPHILTGEWYQNNKPYAEYVREAYADNETYATLKENDYSIGVYTSLAYLNPEYDMYTNVEEGKYIVGNYKAFAQTMYRLVAFNYMPHQFKQFFYTTTADFDVLKEAEGKNKSYSSDVQIFYDRFVEEGISLTDTGKSFRIYHVDGVHPPFTFDRNLSSDSDSTYDVYDEALGNFALLELFFEQLKEKGIYDKSSIIVMADHGSNDFKQNPLFMIKNVGENKEFTISEEEMSYDYLQDIFMLLANSNSVEEKDIANIRQEKDPRRFMYYRWNGAWDRQYLPSMIEYITSGTAMDYTNLQETGKFYATSDIFAEYSYSLNRELSFAAEGTANDYCLYGFSGNGEAFTWTDGKSAIMLFAIDEEFNELALSMEYGIYTESQRVIIYANDNEIANYLATGHEEKKFSIPKEYVQGKELKLRFEFPDAISPKERGESEDVREVALCMEKLTISSVNAEKYELNKEISFMAEGAADPYIKYGFFEKEATHTWTDGNKSAMWFDIVGEYENLNLSMEYFTCTESQQVIVSANGNVVADYVAKGTEKKDIQIPGKYLEDGLLLLTFEFPGAASPKELGTSDDARVLALAMKTMTIAPTEAEDYNLGKELSFMEENTAKAYMMYGFAGNEATHTWTDGNKCALLFDIVGEYSDLELIMEYFTFANSQHVIVSANGNVVADYKAEGEEQKSITISGDYVKNGQLLLIFELPDAASPPGEGANADLRKLGLAMKKIAISAKN